MAGRYGPPRTTAALLARIDETRNKLIDPFEALVQRAGRASTDRNTTAANEFRAQTDTATLIKSAEDLQVLIRQLQEMWLFGHLDTRAESGTQDGNAKAVAALLRQLLERQGPVQSAGQAQAMEGQMLRR